MRTTRGEPEVVPVTAKSPAAKEPDLASVGVPETLAALHVNPETGLAHEVNDAVKVVMIRRLGAEERRR